MHYKVCLVLEWNHILVFRRCNHWISADVFIIDQTDLEATTQRFIKIKTEVTGGNDRSCCVYVTILFVT